MTEIQADLFWVAVSGRLHGVDSGGGLVNESCDCPAFGCDASNL